MESTTFTTPWLLQTQHRVESCTPLQSFPQFNKLPLELRCMIWHYATQSRLIKLLPRPEPPKPPSAPIPLCHTICKESRDFSLRMYSAWYLPPGYLDSEVYSKLPTSPIYANFDYDTILFSFELFTLTDTFVMPLVSSLHRDMALMVSNARWGLLKYLTLELADGHVIRRESCAPVFEKCGRSLYGLEVLTFRVKGQPRVMGYPYLSPWIMTQWGEDIFVSTLARRYRFYRFQCRPKGTLSGLREIPKIMVEFVESGNEAVVYDSSVEGSLSAAIGRFDPRWLSTY